MRQDEGGYIVIETIGSFILFLFLILSILTLVNVVALQARVHYALTQAAETLSMYSYVAEVTGAANHLVNLDSEAGTVRKDADEFKSDINGVISGIQSFSLGDAQKHGEAAYNRVIGWGEDTLDDPMETIRLILDYGLDEARGALTEMLIRPMVGRYLSNGDMSGDTYLKSVNVINGLDGLEFYDFSLLDFQNLGDNDSKILDAGGNIRITIRYDIDYTFGALPLPFPKLSVTQVVKTKAWLNGSGEGYW
ncbi:hypothetical protein FACS1894208_02580 [Clostridia bacterium]|nr:hypothetical protein FACS1894208_02580 [Clostridia bacterium]